MLFGSDVLDTWDVRPITGYINLIHIVVNVLGLVYWIRLGMRAYKKKNTRPSIDMLFEIGFWFFMFILSLIEYIIKFFITNKKYFRVYGWYSMAMAFFSMVENYWTKNLEMRVDRIKSQFINNVEDAFDDFTEACVEEPKRGNMIEFDKKLNDFTTMFAVLVAQQQEALTVTHQQQEALRQRVSRAIGALIDGDQEVQTIQVMRDKAGTVFKDILIGLLVWISYFYFIWKNSCWMICTHPTLM